MLGKTHALAGLSIGLFFSLLFSSTFLVSLFYIVVALFGSLLPDIDERSSILGRKVQLIGLFSRHRGFFHSLLFLAICLLPLYLFFSLEIVLLFAIAFLSHLLLDASTRQGISFFPFGRLRGVLRTGGYTELLIRFFLFLACIFFLFRAEFMQGFLLF